MTTTTQAPTAVADHKDLRRAFSLFPSGVTAVCALVGGEPVGLAASSFTTVSLDPPLVSVAFGNKSRTWARLREATHIGISVLAEEHAEYCRVLAGPEAERFVGVEWSATPEGAVHIGGSALMLTCSIADVTTAGDHDVAFFTVHEILGQTPVEPLLFHGSKFRRVADRPNARR
ncbi:flavin reductase family protein [Streptomyces sp. NPDC091219]|uniref:flavin reductase family protein n=1 Tax=Streptomyces sp. NPDC091219 TaxID=3155193 RepID=UPI00344D8871